MLIALRKIWFYTKLFFTSIMILWRFLATLSCGAGLGFSGEYFYMSLKTPPETWNIWILVTGGFSLILAMILLWGKISRHITTVHAHKNLQETIRLYENSPIKNSGQSNTAAEDGTYFELHEKVVVPLMKQRLPQFLRHFKSGKE